MRPAVGCLMGTSIAGIEISWERRRDLFTLDPALAHLNHGSFGAVPIPVQRAQQHVRDEMDANPVGFFNRGLIDRITHTRRHIAAFLGADADGTAMAANATTATQLVLNSLRPEPGDEILVTDHGYAAARLAADRLCERTGAVVREVRVPLGAEDDEVVALVLGAARPGRTRLAIVDQVTSPTATLLPVSRIAAGLREREIPLLVDGAHAPGMLAVDVSAIGADFWVGNLHKWAFAPRPTAVLVAAPHRRATIDPLVVSFEVHAGFPGSVEFAGTLDYTPWLAAPAGLHLLRTLEPDRVRQHNIELVERGQRVVAAALDLDPSLLPNQTGPVSMRVVPLPADLEDPEVARDLQRRLALEHGCEVALSLWNGFAFVRLSAQIYNHAEDYERLGAALAALRRSRRGSRAA